MEIESLFSSTRWEILKALSQTSLSPMELADSMKTTSANISQQLRLLELAGLVKSEKTSNSDKGKPRVVYSLASENAYLILALPGFTEKKMLSLSAYHRFIMRSWFLENQDHHLLISEIYEKIKDVLPSCDLVAAQSTGSSLTVYIASKKAEQLKKIDVPKVKLVFADLEDIRKKQDLIILHNHSEMLNKEVKR